MTCFTECFFIVAGADFTSLVRKLVFDENTMEIIVDIAVIDDTIVEGEETFTVSLVRDFLDPPDVVIVFPDATTVRILDDDSELYGFVFSAAL